MIGRSRQGAEPGGDVQWTETAREISLRRWTRSIAITILPLRHMVRTIKAAARLSTHNRPHQSVAVCVRLASRPRRETARGWLRSPHR